MTALIASRALISGLERRPSQAARVQGLRALFGRLAAAAQADTARRSVAHMPEHMLRDIGLSRADIDVIDL